ncbi:MAG: GGDEF domain-containing protein [Spirochaetia bacterium]
MHHDKGQDSAVPTSFEAPYATVLSHSDRLFRAMALIALAGHTVILVASAVAGILALVWFNVGSVAVYLLAYHCACSGRLQGAFIIGVLEVVAHSWFATALLGFSSGFHIYALSLIPLAMTFEPWSIRVRVGFTFFLILDYVVLAVAGTLLFAPVTGLFVDVFRYGNFAVGGMVLAAISYYYVRIVWLAEGALVRQNRELASLSRTDQLTDLPNRRYALEWIAHEQARVARYGTTTCVCIADLDYFKRINDEHGHQAGDAVLAHIAKVIRTTVREEDVTARWGGEEFLVLLPDTDVGGGLIAMEKVRSAVSAAYVDWEGTPIDPSVTIGVATVSAQTSVDEAIRRADQALYRGKEAGRNRVESEQSIDEAVST